MPIQIIQHVWDVFKLIIWLAVQNVFSANHKTQLVFPTCFAYDDTIGFYCFFVVAFISVSNFFTRHSIIHSSCSIESQFGSCRMKTLWCPWRFEDFIFACRIQSKANKFTLLQKISEIFASQSERNSNSRMQNFRAGRKLHSQNSLSALFRVFYTK